MPRRSRSSFSGWILTAVAFAATATVAGALLSWALNSSWEMTSTTIALAFMVFVAVGDLLEIPLERNSVFSLGLAPGIAFALIRDTSQTPHIGEVAMVFIAGNVGAVLVRLLRGQELRLPSLAARALVVITAAAAYRAVAAAIPTALTFGTQKTSGPGLLAVLVVVVLLDVALQSALAVAEQRLGVRQTVRDQLRATELLLLSTVSVGALLALAYPGLQYWALPLFLAPLAATQYSFKQVTTIRRNYLQTVGALSKVPEMAGYTVRGHSGRVARLSVDIAKELGIGDPELHEIEYGALLHDIGRISLPDPEEDSKSTSQLELALVGAEIVEKTGHFPRVATMVRQQQEPYRRRGEESNPGLTRGAKIIKVASAYDDLTEPTGPGRAAWDALERMHLGMAYDYDPQVIQALTRVLEGRGLI